MSSAYETFKFTHGGREFIASLYADDTRETPWEHSEGHGPVRYDTARSKHEGERVMGDVDRGGCAWLYDVQAAIALAHKDGWGVGDDEIAALTKKHGRAPTRGEIVARAVEKDFDFLRGWCNDDWHYCGVAVQALDADGKPMGDEFEHALWGIESNAGDYLKEVAAELAGQVPAPPTFADEMQALAKRMHAAADDAPINADALRAAADNLQQIAPTLDKASQ